MFDHLKFQPQIRKLFISMTGLILFRPAIFSFLNDQRLSTNTLVVT